MDRTLIGRCGKYCGECRIYLAARGDAAAREQLAHELGVAPEKISCAGCQGLTPSCYAFGCNIVACLEEHAYRYCAQCPDINDCTKYARLNAEHGGRPRIYASQLRTWGEERWLKYRQGDAEAKGRD